VKLKYPTSPEVIIPENIHTISIVNRSLTKEEDKQNTVFESIITGEIAGSDKRASDECLKGVYDRINDWKQLNIVIPPKTRLYGTGTREIPELLSWKLVKQICDTTKADALLVLETFDSNSDVILSNVVNQVNSVISGNTNVPPPVNQVRMNVICFWRLYDPVNQKIIDQYQSTSYLTFDASGPGLTLPPPDALPRTAYAAGQQYIQRFIPGYYYVKRDMYKRGKDGEKQQFLAAFRRSEVADWEGASEIWSQLAKSRNRVNAGRACLNMAVACEVLGKTALAKDWAMKSYTDYGNKLGRDYANILKDRLRYE
jgi:hypothetical protein